MKKNILLLLFIFIHIMAWTQTRIDVRPSISMQHSFSNYTSRTNIFLNSNGLNLLPNLGLFVDIHLTNKYKITTGIVGTSIGTSYKIYINPQSSLEIINSGNLFQIPLHFSYTFKNKYLNWGSPFRKVKLDVFGGANIDIMDNNIDWNAGNFSMSFNGASANSREYSSVLKKSSISGLLGVGFQFYGQKRPTLRFEIFYRQGFENLLQTEVKINNHQAIIKGKGTALGINISYPINIWKEKTKRLPENNQIDSSSVVHKNNYPIFYFRPTMNIQTNIAQVTQNTNTYENSLDNLSTGFGFFVDYSLSKRWTFSAGLLKNKITTPYFFYSSDDQIGREIGTNIYQIPILATIKTNKIYVGVGNIAHKMSIDFSSGFSFDFIPEKRNKQIEKNDVYSVDKIQTIEKQVMTISNNKNFSLLNGIGLQFYGKKSPTFKLELLYKQGFFEVLETNVSNQNLGNITNAKIKSQGSAIVFNVSYSFKISEKKIK